MTKKWNKMLDRLEKRAGEIKSLEIRLAKQKEDSAQFYKWWQDEVAVTEQLEKDAVDLKAKLALTPADQMAPAVKLTIDEILNEDS